MAEKFGVILEDYKLTPNQVSLIEWLKAHPRSRLEIMTSESGEPMQAIVPTEDGLGKQSLSFSEFYKIYKDNGKK